MPSKSASKKPARPQAGRARNLAAGDPNVKEGLRKTASKGGHAVAAKRGHEFFSEIGKKGGKTVSQKRGKGFYQAIGKKGGQAKAK